MAKKPKKKLSKATKKALGESRADLAFINLNKQVIGGGGPERQRPKSAALLAGKQRRLKQRAKEAEVRREKEKIATRTKAAKAKAASTKTRRRKRLGLKSKK